MASIKETAKKTAEIFTPKKAYMTEEQQEEYRHANFTCFNKTNFSFLKQQDGCRPRKMQVVLGQSGKGKTTFITSMIRDALLNGSRVYLILSEQSIEDVQYPLNKFFKKEFPDRAEEMLNRLEINSALDWAECEMDQAKYITVLKKTIRASKPDIIILDNLTTLSEYNDQIPAVQSSFATSLKRMIQDKTLHPISLVVVVHTGASEKGNDWFPALESIRGNKTIINGAEYVWSIHKFQKQISLSSGALYTYNFAGIQVIKQGRTGAESQSYFHLLYDQDYGFYMQDVVFPMKLIRNMVSAKEGTEWHDQINEYLQQKADADEFARKNPTMSDEEIANGLF